MLETVLTINTIGGGGGITAVNGGAGITADTDADTGVVSLTNTGVLALTAGTGITITGTNDNKTINATGTNTFADVVITNTGNTANLAVNAASNLTVNTEIVATEPWVAGAYMPINKIISGQFIYNTSTLTAGAFITTEFTVANLNCNASVVGLMTPATVSSDNVVYACGIEWAGNSGTDARFTVSIANYSTNNGSVNNRAFNYIIIRP